MHAREDCCYCSQNDEPKISKQTARWYNRNFFPVIPRAFSTVKRHCCFIDQKLQLNKLLFVAHLAFQSPITHRFSKYIHLLPVVPAFYTFSAGTISCAIAHQMHRYCFHVKHCSNLHTRESRSIAEHYHMLTTVELRSVGRKNCLVPPTGRENFSLSLDQWFPIG